MKTLVLSVFLFLAVVCPMQAQRVVLPIGEQAVTAYQWSNLVNARVAVARSDTGTHLGAVPRPINPDLSSIASSAREMNWFAWADFTQPREVWIEVHVEGKDGTTVLYFHGPSFRINGPGPIPDSALEFGTPTEVVAGAKYGPFISTLAIRAPEVRWIEYGYTFPGLDLTPQITRNGWATNCWASSLFGNGWIYLDGWVLSGNRLKSVQAVDGPDAGEYVTLWFDEGRTVGERWDIGTGQWTPIGSPVSSTEPKLVLRLSSSSVAVGATDCEPGKAYTFTEHVTLGDAGVVIGTVYASDEGRASLYARFESGVPSRFFSIRLATQAEVPGAKPAPAVGASFP